MSTNTKTILIAVVALIVGAAAGAGFGMMQVDEVTQRLVVTTQEKEQAQQNAERLRKMNDEASRKYGNELGRLVTVAAALPAPVAAPAQVQPETPAVPGAAPAPAPPPAPLSDDAAKLIDQTRTILAMRDGFRATLDGVRASMNSEFDALAAELGNPAPDAVKVKQTLDTLKQNWPAKEKGMDEATRRLMADLGLLLTPKPKPAGAPAPAPAQSK